MKLETPHWLDHSIEIVESNQFLSWLGLLLALGGSGWTAFAHSEQWAALLLAIALAIGGLLGWGIKRSRSPVRCLSCVEEYTLSGVRGQNATSRSTMKFVFKKPLDGFTSGIKRSTGGVTNEHYFYRCLGRYGKDKNAAQREFGAGNLAVSPQIVEGHKVYIRLPSPARVNDYYEVVRVYSLTDSFPADNEEAGKFILHPTKSLKIKIKFNNCVPQNVLGYASKDYLPVPGSHAALDVHPDGDGGNIVEWDIENAEPGQRYTVQWVWG